MRNKIFNEITVIMIITMLLIPVTFFVSSSAVRIVFGIPFLLFSPGYTLVAALFPSSKRTMGGLERIALSVVMSFVIVGLTGLALNYTPWGVRPEPVIYSVSALVLVTSIIALVRRAKSTGQTGQIPDFKLKLPHWKQSDAKKPLTIFLVISILIATGILGYKIANTKGGEQYTGFYILGNNGRAEDYPTEFLMVGGQVSGVSYDWGATVINTNRGKITLGIVNYEQQKASYAVTVKIDGEQVAINYAGNNVSELNQIELRQGEKWEQEIGFAPQHTGDNQRVEFDLYKDGADTPYNTLHLRINVKEAQ